MILALGQINTIVGDIEGNSARILDCLARAKRAGVQLAAFPELAIVGYPPKDLLLKPRIIRENQAALERIARACTDVVAIVGYVGENTQPAGRRLHNSAAVCAQGKVLSVHHKSLLPTYDVFDESRYFEPARAVQPTVITLPGNQGVTCGLTVCEDLWGQDQTTLGQPIYGVDPIAQLAASGAELLINIAASPYWLGKHEVRVRLFGEQVRRRKLPLVFVNQVGGNDELIFDGSSMAFDATGKLISQANAFAEDLLLVDLTAREPGRIEPVPTGVAALHEALVLGTRDYAAKCGFKEAVIGLSGGIDSATTAALATTALGKEHVHGLAMPSRYSSDQSLADAKELAGNLGIDFRAVSIGELHAGYEEQLTPYFEGLPPDITEENIQARIRANILMALSNKFGWLVLTTGNKSELAVGYCTLYGDMCGGLAVISDVPKTMVYELARYINDKAGRQVIPQSSLAKPPSAELKPGQLDQDSLPPYETLDRILQLYVEQEQSAEEIVAAGFDEALVREVTRRVDRNEYKRKQAPPGLKVTSRAFGFGRRMPIAARYS